MNSPSHRNRHQTPLTFEDLQPITACGRTLEVLDVEVAGLVGWSDKEVESLVSHLPLLRELTIRTDEESRGTWSDPPHTTLHAIAVITSFCPKIHTIAVDIDARIVAEPPEQAHRALRILQVYNSPVVDPTAVASFLVRLSQSEDFSIDGHQSSPYCEGWNAVRDAMPALRQALAQVGETD